jgi:hypothetical protein
MSETYQEPGRPRRQKGDGESEDSQPQFLIRANLSTVAVSRIGDRKEAFWQSYLFAVRSSADKAVTESFDDLEAVVRYHFPIHLRGRFVDFLNSYSAADRDTQRKRDAARDARHSAMEEREDAAHFVLANGEHLYLPSLIRTESFQIDMMEHAGLEVVRAKSISATAVPAPHSSKIEGCESIVTGYFLRRPL